MILDGKKGLFYFVLVKSLSRFGRDTVETLTQIRKWKQMRIGLYAEMENIDTMKVNDSALRPFLTMAQEESCSKSKNINLAFEHVCAAEKQFSTTVNFWVILKDRMGYWLSFLKKPRSYAKFLICIYKEGKGGGIMDHPDITSDFSGCG